MQRHKPEMHSCVCLILLATDKCLEKGVEDRVHVNHIAKHASRTSRGKGACEEWSTVTECCSLFQQVGINGRRKVRGFKCGQRCRIQRRGMDIDRLIDWGSSCQWLRWEVVVEKDIPKTGTGMMEFSSWRGQRGGVCQDWIPVCINMA